VAPAYTVRLGLVSIPPGTDRTVYAVPSAGSAVVRDVCIDNMAGTAVPHILYIKSGSATAALSRGPIAASSVLHMDLRQALRGSDELHVLNQDTTATLYCVATGYVFS
jgi:hypothetical protein